MSNALWRCGSKGFHLHRRQTGFRDSGAEELVGWNRGPNRARTHGEGLSYSDSVLLSEADTHAPRCPAACALLPATVTPAAATAGSLWLSGLNERFGRQPAGLPGFTIIRTEPELRAPRARQRIERHARRARQAHERLELGSI